MHIRLSRTLRLGPALAALAAAPALAQEVPPQAGATAPETVVTATRIPTPQQDLPASVTVITRAQIELNDDVSIVQALQAVPGLRVVQSGGLGGNASVFIRGANSNQALVLLDGFPLNDASDAGGAYNFGLDVLGDVERIEIVRGPMASVYGSGAIGGVVNIITRRGAEPGVHAFFDQSAGYPAQGNSINVVSGVTGTFDYAATVQLLDQRGFDSTPQRESIYTGVPQGFSTELGNLNLGYTPLPGTRLSLLIRAQHSVFGFNALGTPTFDDSNSTGYVTSVLERLGATSKLAGGAVETSLFMGWLQGQRQYTESLNPNDPNMASNDSCYRSGRSDLQWNNVVHLNQALGGSPFSVLDLTFGYERTADNAYVNVVSSSDGFPYAQSTSAAETDNAIYAGLQATISRLTLTAQLRQDWVVNDSPTTWRAGLLFDIPEIGARLKGSYGTAFLAPSLFDRYGVDSTGYVGNPNLLPETAQGWEAGFVKNVAAFGRKDFAQLSATYFNERITNLIEEVFSPVVTSVNVGSAHIQGAEVELLLVPSRWMSVDASYTYTYPIDADTGEKLLRRPQNMASLEARITPLPRLTIAPQLLFTGAFQDYLVDNSGIETGGIGTSQQGLIFNLTASYRLSPRITLYASGKNIFNSKFEPANGYQTPGPTAIAGVRIGL
ncbi:MAG TPA: TonB-dependent receptor [Acetobacteraceae bacterium]|nr:TonB-dependent receptor [Acetobacteraceae bacterium]